MSSGASLCAANGDPIMAEVTLEQVSQTAKDLFNRGFVAMERGNLDYAMDMFTACIGEEPNFHRARKFLRAAEIKAFKNRGGNRFTHVITTITGLSSVLTATALLNSGKPAQAMAAIEKVLRKDPLNLSHLKILCKAAEMMDEPDIAIQALAMAREHYPRNPEVLGRLGNLYMKTDQPRLGRECFELLCEIKPNDAEALKSLKDAMALDSMSKDGWAEAAKTGASFQAMIKDKKEASILEKEAKAVKTQNDIEALIEENKTRIQREPGNINYRRALASLYASNRMFEAAAATLRDAQAVAGGRDPQIDQALSSIQLQSFDEEIKRLRAGNMTAAAESKEKERSDFLFRDTEERAGRYPNDLQVKYEYGVLLYQQGKINEAIQQFQAAQRNAQRRVSSLYYIGLCFKAKQQYDMALEQFDKAQSEIPVMDDQKKAALYELGRTLELMNRPAEALDNYKRIYQVDIGYRDVADKVEHGYRTPPAGA